MSFYSLLFVQKSWSHGPKIKKRGMYCNPKTHKGGVPGLGIETTITVRPFIATRSKDAKLLHRMRPWVCRWVLGVMCIVRVCVCVCV